DHLAVVIAGMRQKIFCNFAIIMAWIVEDFRHRAFGAVEIPRQARVTSQMRWRSPLFMVGTRIAVRFFEPRFVLMAVGFFRLVHGENHRSQKWRLRTSEIVGTVRV